MRTYYLIIFALHSSLMFQLVNFSWQDFDQLINQYSIQATYLDHEVCVVVADVEEDNQLLSDAPQYSAYRESCNDQGILRYSILVLQLHILWDNSYSQTPKKHPMVFYKHFFLQRLTIGTLIPTTHPQSSPLTSRTVCRSWKRETRIPYAAGKRRRSQLQSINDFPSYSDFPITRNVNVSQNSWNRRLLISKIKAWRAEF